MSQRTAIKLTLALRAQGLPLQQRVALAILHRQCVHRTRCQHLVGHVVNRRHQPTDIHTPALPSGDELLPLTVAGRCYLYRLAAVRDGGRPCPCHGCPVERDD